MIAIPAIFHDNGCDGYKWMNLSRALTMSTLSCVIVDANDGK